MRRFLFAAILAPALLLAQGRIDLTTGSCSTLPSAGQQRVCAQTTPAQLVCLNADGSSCLPTASESGAEAYGLGVSDTAQAQRVALTPVPNSLIPGLVVRWLPDVANTGAAPTLTAAPLAAKSITKCGAEALAAGDVSTTAVAVAIYDGTQYELQNPQTGPCGTVAHSGLPALISGDIPNNAANTTGTAGGLLAQYIDWSASSGGASIANKPTIPTITGSGALKGSSGNAVAALFGDIVSLWSMCASGTPFMRYDGTCAAVSGSGTVTSIGLSGTANQITITGSSPITASGSWTASLPALLTLPGTLNKITFTAPATAWTIVPLGDNQTTTIPGGTLVNTAGNVATATSLAANPTICSGGQLSAGVLANGNATGCTSLPAPDKQLSVAIYDLNNALAATPTPVQFWTPEYASATITQVKCMSDTADLVIMLSQTGGNILSGNMTCGYAGWNTPVTSFTTQATLSTSQILGFSVISGTAKRFTLSIKYAGN